MPLTTDLMASGMSPPLASLLGLVPTVAVTAAGTTTGGATVINRQQNNVGVTTAASNTGIRLPSDAPTGVVYFVTYVTGGQSILVYPPTGAAFNGGSADAARTITTTTGGGIFWRTGSLTWGCNISA